MSSHSIDEVAENFAKYVAEVVECGETLMVTRDGHPLVKVRPAKPGLRVRDLPAFLASLPPIDPEDREAFARDLEAAHAELNALPLPPDSWES